jgi:hypothetical protein
MKINVGLEKEESYMFSLMCSSIGWHTATIFKKLTLKEAYSLYGDFKKFGNETKEIKTYPIRVPKIPPDANEFTKWVYSSPPEYHRMEYLNKRKGLRWEMRSSESSPAYIKSKMDEDKPCSIKAKITPKVLNGENDYLNAATEDCLVDVKISFNTEAEKISPLLEKYNSYAYSRIDYCFNGDTQELNTGCTTEQMMKLIKRSNIPNSFNERMKYDKNSHREKPDKHCFYLKSNSVVINCYCKGKQLEKQYPNNPSLEDSRNVIRFEVQCKYPKVYTMSSIIKKRNGNSKIILEEMVSNKVCEDIISKYFNKIIRKGNYFTLDDARCIIKEYNFRKDKEKRLIRTLELVNEYRGITKAKSKLWSDDLKDFKRSLNDLDAIFVNPVTIPRNWNIVHIPNLLQAYYDTRYEQLVPISEVLARKRIAAYLSNVAKQYKY